MFRGLIRTLRAGLGVALGAFIGHLQGAPEWVFLGPALNGVAKILRAKWPKKFDWLPF